jgi:hypothetical protein
MKRRSAALFPSCPYNKIVQDPDVDFDLYGADIWATAHEPGWGASRSAHLVGGVEARLPREIPRASLLRAPGCPHIREKLMTRTMLALCAAASLSLAGCAGGAVRLVNPRAAHPPVHEDQVRVFMADDTVPAECERYAHFEVISDPLTKSTPEALADIRRRAGTAGANAVQVTGMRNPSTARAVASVLLPELRWRKGQVAAFRCPV